VTALVVAALCAREVSRRHTAVALVVALPLWFYLVRRELPGQCVRVQMLADPGDLVATLLPFWSVREAAGYAVDDAGPDHLWRALAHAALTWLLCLGGTLALFGRRLRVVRCPEP